MCFWDGLSSSPKAFYLLEQNQCKINWRLLLTNPNAIDLLEQNLDKINWYCLSRNPNAIGDGYASIRMLVIY